MTVTGRSALATNRATPSLRRTAASRSWKRPSAMSCGVWNLERSGSVPVKTSTPICWLPCLVTTMPKYDVEGSPSDGYRIWQTTEDGDVVEQESPPFHAPCEAWVWGIERGIEATIPSMSLT